jgi:hypothetical protein
MKIARAYQAKTMPQPEAKVVVEQRGEGVETGQHNALPVIIVKLHGYGQRPGVLRGEVQGEVIPAAGLQGAHSGVGESQGYQRAVAVSPPETCTVQKRVMSEW